MANQLRAHLHTTLPGAIGLVRDIDSPITLAFLTRFPPKPRLSGSVGVCPSDRTVARGEMLLPGRGVMDVEISKVHSGIP